MTSTAFGVDEYDALYPDGIAHHYWTLARNIHIYNTLKGRCGDAHRVLEVGCGRGLVVDYLRQRGVECDGCELGTPRPYAERVEPYVSLGVSSCELDESKRASYDTLLFCDVLEHIQNPGAFLKEHLTAFPNVRHVVATFPARKELWSNYDVMCGHFMRYTGEDVEMLFKRSGLEMLEVRDMFRMLYLPAWLVVKVLKKRSMRILSPQAWRRPIDRSLAHLVVASDGICTFAPGTSIIAVGRV